MDGSTKKPGMTALRLRSERSNESAWSDAGFDYCAPYLTEPCSTSMWRATNPQSPNPGESPRICRRCDGDGREWRDAKTEKARRNAAGCAIGNAVSRELRRGLAIDEYAILVSRSECLSLKLALDFLLLKIKYLHLDFLSKIIKSLLFLYVIFLYIYQSSS